MGKLEAFLLRKRIFYKVQYEKVWISTNVLAFREPYIIKKLFRLCFRNKIDIQISSNYVTMQAQLPKIKQLKP